MERVAVMEYVSVEDSSRELILVQELRVVLLQVVVVAPYVDLLRLAPEPRSQWPEYLSW